MQICWTMKVEVVFRVLPKNAETDIKRLEEEIRKKLLPEKIEREPIAFGIFSIKFSKLVKDEAGELEKIETILKQIDEVGEYDIILITKVL